MKLSAVLTLFVLAFVLSGSIYANTSQLNALAEQVLSADERTAAESISRLRSSGPQGLKALFDTYSTEINTFRAEGVDSEKWRKIAAAIDAVAMQKDAYASGLYWYTDLDEAKKAAKKADKPILTLRLLGNLNEEFSCANSRLFRSLLYANTEVSNYLRENYILHWKSVRPAPRITIDFGDGRKIERTITGNSIHYVIDDGRIIEALPGLYSPKAFVAYLTQAKRVRDANDGKDRRQREKAFMTYRKQSFDRLKDRRDKAVAEAKVTLTEPMPPNSLNVYRVDALLASPLAMSKSIVVDEVSMLRVYDSFYAFEPQIDFSEWQKLAGIYSPMPELDMASTAFVRRQTAGTGLTEAEFGGMFARLRSFVGLDTTRNEFLMHPRLYEWLNQDPAVELESFNSHVYAEMFKTPDSDKWLGLYSTDVYTALDGNGITK
jgi:hypothetical protein